MDYNKLVEIKKNLLLDEYKNLRKFYVSFAKKIEAERIDFAKKNIIKNVKNNENFIIKNDFKSYIKSYFNTIIQRLLYNKTIAKNENLIPFFITFTAPSAYHPFKTFGKKSIDNWELNENFAFNSVKEASYQAYKKLNEIFRYFYKYLKTGKRSIRKYGRNVRYNGFFEYHKTFIPHFHILVYVPEEIAENWIYQAYNETLKKFGMNPKSNKIIEITAINEMDEIENDNNDIDELDGAVLYISKYISKNLKDIFEIPDDLDNLSDILDDEIFNKYKEKQENLYMFMGWKIFNNIRIFRGNNTEIGILNYKKIYSRLEENEKNELLEKAKTNKTCLLYEIEKISTRYIIIKYENGKQKEKIKCGGKNDAKFFIKEVKKRKENYNFVGIYNFFKLFDFFNKYKYELINDMKFDYLPLNINNYWAYVDEELMEEYKIKAVNKLIASANNFINYFNKEFEKLNYDDTDLSAFSRIINYKLNKNKSHFLLFIKFFKKKEKLYKKFIKEFASLLKKTEKIPAAIKSKFFEIVDNLKSYINGNLSFDNLFFYYSYENIEYFIEKDFVEIYNKNDYEIVEL